MVFVVFLMSHHHHTRLFIVAQNGISFLSRSKPERNNIQQLINHSLCKFSELWECSCLCCATVLTQFMNKLTCSTVNKCSLKEGTGHIKETVYNYRNISKRWYRYRCRKRIKGALNLLDVLPQFMENYRKFSYFTWIIYKNLLFSKE